MAKTDKIFDRRSKVQLQSKTRKGRQQRSAAAGVEATVALQLRNDVQPDLTVVNRAIDTLRPANRRTRRTSDEQLMRVMRSLQTFQQVAPILIDDQGRIIAGHIVWEAMARLGAETIQCIVVTHLDERELRAYAIAANRLGELGEWMLDELGIELKELEALDFKLDTLGFSLPELDIIMSDPAHPDEADVDEVDKTAAVVTRPGDLFALGPHLVLCGDSLKQASYVLLMRDDRAACVFSDPPYNCKIEGHVSGLGKTKHKDFAMAVGEMSPAEFGNFLSAYLDHCKAWSSAGAVVFACMDWRQIDVLYAAGRTAGLTLINVAIWIKGGGMGSLYRSAYEEIAVFCVGDTPASNQVMLGANGRDRTNVWEYPGANRKGSSSAKALADHPTPKPVDLVADALMDVTQRGDIVLDPFLGSGSTLIACEKARRIGRFIELDPRYVDLAIRRWQKVTGEAAVHVETGQTYQSLADHRGGTANGGEDKADLDDDDDTDDDALDRVTDGRIAGLIEGSRNLLPGADR